MFCIGYEVITSVQLVIGWNSMLSLPKHGPNLKPVVTSLARLPGLSGGGGRPNSQTDSAERNIEICWILYTLSFLQSTLMVNPKTHNKAIQFPSKPINMKRKNYVTNKTGFFVKIEPSHKFTVNTRGINGEVLERLVSQAGQRHRAGSRCSFRPVAADVLHGLSHWHRLSIPACQFQGAVGGRNWRAGAVVFYQGTDGGRVFQKKAKKRAFRYSWPYPSTPGRRPMSRHKSRPQKSIRSRSGPKLARPSDLDSSGRII